MTTQQDNDTNVTDEGPIKSVVKYRIAATFPLSKGGMGFLLARVMSDDTPVQFYAAVKTELEQVTTLSAERYVDITEATYAELGKVTRPHCLLQIGPGPVGELAKHIRKQFLIYLFNGPLFSGKAKRLKNITPAIVFDDGVLVLLEGLYRHFYDKSLNDELKESNYQYERQSVFTEIGGKRYQTPRTLYYYPDHKLVTSRWIIGAKGSKITKHPECETPDSPFNGKQVKTLDMVIQIHHHHNDEGWTPFGTIYNDDDKIRSLVDNFIDLGYLDSSEDKPTPEE